MKKIHTLAALLFLVFSSCKKEYDVPPVKNAETGTKINVATIKSKYKTGAAYRFLSDSNLYCMVIADEVSGNLHNEFYVRDATGALHIKVLSGGGLFIGDSIRVNLKGSILNDYGGLIQLDSLDADNNVVKLAS